MSTLLQSLAGRAEGTRIVPLYDDALVCCSRTGWLGWTLAYLLRGTIGNYLLGEPPFDDALARAGESIGGIATVLPFRTGFDADARRWFRRFGCEWIHPLSPVPGPVRTRAGRSPRRGQPNVPSGTDLTRTWHCSQISFAWRVSSYLKIPRKN